MLKCIVVSFSLLSLMTCNRINTEKISENESVLKETISELQKDCFADRKTTGTLSNVSGTTMKIGDQFYINIMETKRYHPCNIPEEFKTENLNVTFSGEIKEIFPHERRAGTPFVLDKISLN